MARQEQILYLEDDDFPGFNLSFWAGRGAMNERGDVMLIQALINFIADAKGVSQTGLQFAGSLPRVTGTMDGSTKNAIAAFQFRWMRLLLPTHMGLLFPIPKDYRLKHLQDRRPTMIMLNELAQDSKGGTSVTLPQALLQAFPDLRPLLKP